MNSIGWSKYASILKENLEIEVEEIMNCKN